jgi:hypothetical protein
MLSLLPHSHMQPSIITNKGKALIPANGWLLVMALYHLKLHRALSVYPDRRLGHIEHPTMC